MKTFEAILELALQEDLGDAGDVTSTAIFAAETAAATLSSKDEGVLAGLPFFERVMKRVDQGIECTFFYSDGDRLHPKDVVAKITGKTVSILQAERTAVNFLSFLSGIATKTKKFTDAAEKSGKAVILDTRKTLPGYREMSKYAVRAGNGKNHRMGLYDMVMIKDNHSSAAGGITRAVETVRRKWGEKYKIEVECRNVDDVKEALSNRVEIIMLDNMSVDECAAAAALPHEGVLLEASGNMDLQKIEQYSATGIDYISVGELTHSVKAFDFSLQINEEI